jgi:uncharacterized Zn finger protein
MWWSQRILRLLEGAELGREISRGQAYAAEGRVISLSVTPGRISASVMGTRPDPYRVLLEVTPVKPAVWEALLAQTLSRPAARASLLRGTLPGELARLIPTDPVDVAIQCTCPIHDAICKHAAAVFFDLAARLVDEPMLLLTWRGCDTAGLDVLLEEPEVRSA